MLLFNLLKMDKRGLLAEYLMKHRLIRLMNSFASIFFFFLQSRYSQMTFTTNLKVRFHPLRKSYVKRCVADALFEQLYAESSIILGFVALNISPIVQLVLWTCNGWFLCLFWSGGLKCKFNFHVATIKRDGDGANFQGRERELSFAYTSPWTFSLLFLSVWFKARVKNIFSLHVLIRIQCIELMCRWSKYDSLQCFNISALVLLSAFATCFLDYHLLRQKSRRSVCSF